MIGMFGWQQLAAGLAGAAWDAIVGGSTENQDPNESYINTAKDQLAKQDQARIAAYQALQALGPENEENSNTDAHPDSPRHKAKTKLLESTNAYQAALAAFKETYPGTPAPDSTAGLDVLSAIVRLTGDRVTHNRKHEPNEEKRDQAIKEYQTALKELSAEKQSPKRRANTHHVTEQPSHEAWVEAITKDQSTHRLKPTDINANTFDNNKLLFLRRQAEDFIEMAEGLRGITHTRRIITLGGANKTVLYRDATKVLESLTPEQQNRISNLEFLSTWSISAAAACKIADTFDADKKQAFMKELSALIERNADATLEKSQGKTIYTERMQKLFSLLGAFLPDDSLEDISERLEAERDMLAIEDPTEVVATLRKNDADNTETVYEIEFPNTKLSPEQKAFFEMANDSAKTDHDIGLAYHFYQNLTPWQKAIIRRDAFKILQENRLRPSQMQFLPMAPNFWTRHTVVKAADQSIQCVNVISRCGALSPRVKADKEGLIQFQKMQYGQVRTNFDLSKDDKLCYTSYKQNFYGLGADDGALKHISDAHDNDEEFAKRNPIFNIPMGRYSPVSRFMNGVHNFFSHNKFQENSADPLLSEALNIINNVLSIDNPHSFESGNIRQIHDLDTIVPIEKFIQAKMFNFPVGTVITPAMAKLLEEIKLDAEQIYRYVIEMDQLRNNSFNKNNLRIAALRATLYHELTAFTQKVNELPGAGRINTQLVYQAYISGCKSNIDRGTLVALHAEIIALKSYERKKLWKKTFTAPTTSTSWLSTKLFLTNMALHWLFPLTAFVNLFSPLKQNKAYFLKAKMERELPGINADLNNPNVSPVEKAKLLQQKSDLINAAVDADLSIEASVCKSGHSRIMPSHGGSIAVSGIKDSVLDAVAPHLDDHKFHLTSQDKLSSHNHHLAEKCGVKDSRSRAWVSQAHRNAANLPKQTNTIAKTTSTSSTTAPQIVQRQSSAIIPGTKPANSSLTPPLINNSTSINGDIPQPSPGIGVFGGSYSNRR